MLVVISALTPHCVARGLSGRFKRATAIFLKLKQFCLRFCLISLKETSTNIAGPCSYVLSFSTRNEKQFSGQTCCYFKGYCGNELKELASLLVSKIKIILKLLRFTATLKICCFCKQVLFESCGSSQPSLTYLTKSVWVYQAALETNTWLNSWAWRKNFCKKCI